MLAGKKGPGYGCFACSGVGDLGSFKFKSMSVAFAHLILMKNRFFWFSCCHNTFSVSSFAPPPKGFSEHFSPFYCHKLSVLELQVLNACTRTYILLFSIHISDLFSSNGHTLMFPITECYTHPPFTYA